MIERRVYHVRPTKGQTWQVVKEGFRRPHIIRNTKEEAVTMAKRLAKVSSPGRVVVHTPDDDVESQYSYSYFETTEEAPI